jgi:RIO-like serine/threonine protein kinase
MFIFHEKYPNAKKIGEGSYGIYYQLSKKHGIKVLKDDDLTLKRQLYHAQKEMDMLNAANKIGLAPRCYKIINLLYRYNYKKPKWIETYALLVDHVYGKKNYYISQTTLNNINKKLVNIGIEHEDLNSRNIIKEESGKLKIVDFTYGCALYHPRRK